MKPYYQHAGITIYHGDCRGILPTLEFDVLLSDPPYGISHPTNFSDLDGLFYRHDTVNHSAGEYARGPASTNSIEGNYILEYSERY